MCLHEMAQAWTWSLRAIRSLQILAEDWLELARTDSPDFNRAKSPGAASQGMPLSVDDGVLDWLMDIESITPCPTRSLIFDQHLWPVGFSGDDSASKG